MLTILYVIFKGLKDSQSQMFFTLFLCGGILKY